MLSLAYMMAAMPMFLRLLRHCTLIACCRARFSAGRSRAIRTAMMPMTTSNSTSVNARGRRMNNSIYSNKSGTIASPDIQ